MSHRFAITLLVEGSDTTTKEQVRALIDEQGEELMVVLGAVLRMQVLDVDVATADAP